MIETPEGPKPPVDRRLDMTFAVFLLLVGAAALWLGRDFPADSRAWPMAVVGVMMFGAAMALAQLLRGHADEAEVAPMVAPARAAVVLALFVIFLIVMATVGFVTAGVLLTLVVPPVMGERRPWVVVLTTIIFMLGTWFVFTQVFQRVMPYDWFLGG